MQFKYIVSINLENILLLPHFKNETIKAQELGIAQVERDGAKN